MKTLVESCFRLDTRLLKEALHKALREELAEGFLNINYNGKPSALDYKIEYDSGNAYLILSFGHEPQRILLSRHELTYGTRLYLTCMCGARTTALYLHNGVFACRKCQKLQYASNMVNRSSKHGKFLHRQIRIVKLIDMREKIGRPFYRSRQTKRYLHWLRLASRAGMFDELIRTLKLMDGVRGER